MNNILLLATHCVGILASLLMFSGDMFLYFTKKEFKNMDTLRQEIMPQIPAWRLKLGGLIGPFASFFYAIGFFQICLITQERYKLWGAIASGLFILGTIVGGAYHSHYTYIGLLGKLEDKSAVDIVMKNARFLGKLFTLLCACGSLTLSILVALDKTVFPVWFVIFTPTIMIFFVVLWRRLPPPLRIILYGGWSNLQMLAYFAVSFAFIVRSL